ncbi:terminase small subunit [Gammaproteobacteria bacterium]|nr:terminase small subunit [Gammaproteobacteria bacterium]
MTLKNQKHEKFCQVWHETGNKSEAYRKSHPTSLKWKDETVHNAASALSKKGEVLARFKQLQDDALKGHNITIASLLKELDEARAIALTAETPQSSAAITATMSKAKLVGLDKHVVEATVKIEAIDDFNDI